MAENNEDDSQKTEEPTERRLEEAFKKGQTIQSRELTHFLVMLSFTMMMIWLIPSFAKFTTHYSSYYLANAAVIDLSKAGIGRVLIKVAQDVALTLMVPILVIMSIGVLSPFIQNKGKFATSADNIMPNLSRLSPMKGLKKLFSKRSLFELFKILFKILVISYAAYAAVKDKLSQIHIMHQYNLITISSILMDLLIDLLVAACIVMAFIAAFDYLYQWFDFMKSMKMSKQELKEEYKQAEGSPEIKAKLRKIRMDRARNRMMAAVPTADVVIMNPTHFAVALKYDSEAMGAPRVVAKGQDLIALKIRDLAEENDVPIVENPPLARALYASVEIEQEIPVEHYQAVAEVISYVYKLKGKVAN